jgi:hypothetical protein
MSFCGMDDSSSIERVDIELIRDENFYQLRFRLKDFNKQKFHLWFIPYFFFVYQTIYDELNDVEFVEFLSEQHEFEIEDIKAVIDNAILFEVKNLIISSDLIDIGYNRKDTREQLENFTNIYNNNKFTFKKQVNCKGDIDLAYILHPEYLTPHHHEFDDDDSEVEAETTDEESKEQKYGDNIDNDNDDDTVDSNELIIDTDCQRIQNYRINSIEK